MREILFRGKSRNDGKWYQGDLVTVAHKRFIDDDIVKERVIPETVGQYTGLTDKNGKRIFEGDIVQGKDKLEKTLEVLGYVGFKNGSFVIVGELLTHYRWLDYEVEVIGNIRDNLELLKGV